MHIQVKAAHLGIGDLRKRLAVYPAQLEEGHQGEAGAQDRSGIAQRLEIIVAQ